MHTERRKTLGNTNQNKTTRTAGYNVYEKHPQRKHSELKEPEEMLHKAKTLTAIARQKKAKEKSCKTNQSNWKEALQKHSKKNTAYKMLKGTTKPL